MTNWIAPLLSVSVLCAALFAFAFVVAPHSCQWGWTAYLWAGTAVIISLVAMPFYFHLMYPIWRQLLLCLGFGSIGLFVWVAGIFAANIRIICRLI